MKRSKVTDYSVLKGGCTNSSESTLVKIALCWKSHVMAQLFFKERTASGRNHSVAYVDRLRDLHLAEKQSKKLNP